MPEPQSQTSAGRQNVVAIRAVDRKQDVAVTARLRPPETLPDPNEIGRRIAGLWPALQAADERGLRAALEVATLLRMMVDVHGYKGDRYDHFAGQRGINHAGEPWPTPGHTTAFVLRGHE